MTVAVSGDSITFPDNSVQATAPKVGMVNRIINGAMVIDQRNAGASVTGNDGAYPVDRFTILATQTSKFTVQQSTTAPAGFGFSLLATSSSAYSVTSSDYFTIQHRVEGFNSADFSFGSASSSTVTLSFWVRSSLTGTFGGSIVNSAYSRSYPFSFTISAANTWEQKTVSFAGDTTGTWVGATNGTGLRINWSLGAGSSQVGTAGAWSASSALGVTGQTNLVGTSGATFYITGVQLEKGSTATSFDYRPYGTELGLCQRYFEKSYSSGVVANTATSDGNLLFIGSSNGSSLLGYIGMKAVKRAAPTVTIYPPSGGTANTFGNGGTIDGSYIGDSGFGMFTLTLTGSRTAAQWIASSEL